MALTFECTFCCFLISALLASVSEPCTARQESKRTESLTTIENSIGMKLVRVPAGEFLMGSDETPAQLARGFEVYLNQKDEYGIDRLDIRDNQPVHRVRITRSFYLGQHEVTVGQFRQFLALSGYVPESIRDATGGYGFDPDRPAEGDSFAGRNPKYSWQNPGFPQTDQHPVTNVTFEDAMELCKWLSANEGVPYRLPTEAEWEYSCRAGTRTRFCNGDDPNGLAKVGNTFDLDCMTNWKKFPDWRPFVLQANDGFAFTSPVGSLAPNAFGIYDMHGNVWEWCSDFHADDYYSKSPVDDPKGPETGSVRIRRGGSWHTWSLYATASYRNWNSETTRYTLMGIRLVREETPNAK
ncbi:MAG: formylglycine-generating enzyme family protein [Pirellula sp.]